ncbi:hypothetical protein D3C71_1153040 [compost metagenome]
MPPFPQKLGRFSHGSMHICHARENIPERQDVKESGRITCLKEIAARQAYAEFPSIFRGILRVIDALRFED